MKPKRLHFKGNTECAIIYKDRINFWTVGCDEYTIYPEDFKNIPKAIREWKKKWGKSK